ncbi:latrophilin-like protein 1 [Phycodurus eques]|uniref:latrophilin-like protein 1 n=1 Tax=Phycodurus eques TaxID=693459 RepID=UPI002ACDE4FB|nr:latrophilin-like protein 1 [Phycodurus eques]
MRGWIRFICDGLQRCRLPKPNSQMFVCDKTDNFIQIKYKCHKRLPAVKKVVACEKETAHLQCDPSKDLMIIRAKYGRFDEHLCSKTPSIMTFCSSMSAQMIVQDECNGMNECSITADESLGVPHHCDDTPKYLIVDYECL